MKVYKVFPEGKHKVLTMSYDDGKLADLRLVEIFNKYGIKGTFNLNSGLISDANRIPPDQWKELYKGHEIAAHTCTHPTIARCPQSQIIEELLNDRRELEKYTGYPVRGLAYPNGSCSDEVARIAKMCGFKYGRVVSDSFANVALRDMAKPFAQGPMLVGDETGFNPPKDYMQWSATCHHNHNLMEFGRDFISLTKKQYLYMMYVWGHSFEFDKNDNWNVIEDFCELVGNRDDIWYATNIEIVDYNEAFDRLSFAVDMSFVYNPSVMSVWLALNNDTIVEVKGGETKDLRIYE